MLSLMVPAMSGLGNAAKGSEGELGGAGGVGRRFLWHWGSGKAEWVRRS